jgi:hypothetical protein
MKISLINPYELGRQPFGLAEPAAWLEREGCEVSCCDLSIQKLESCLTPDTDVVAIYVAMHTATRIAIEALPRICQLAPRAYLCVYGLYAPMNSGLFRSLGVQTVLGGEYETGLVSMVQRIRAGQGAHQTEPEIALDRIDFIAPDRSTLPDLSQYASLINPDGTRKTVGFVETTRPDFFNGPGHALRIVRALHAEFPAVTYDATIKIEHIVRYPEEMQVLKDTGCLFILSAVEAVDDDILEHLDKGHTRADFVAALARLRNIGIALAPTFVAFTPWTTLENYIELLSHIIDLQLVEAVAPVQLSIRLLIPAGSCIMEIDSLANSIGDFDPAILGHPWSNPDARVDALQQRVQAWVTRAEAEDQARPQIFAGIWKLAHEQAGLPAPPLDLRHTGQPVPRLSENWYCCAEPTCEQLTSI